MIAFPLTFLGSETIFSIYKFLMRRAKIFLMKNTLQNPSEKCFTDSPLSYITI